MLQIRYLKMKLLRESDLRADLSHQKTYISLLLRGLSSTDDKLGKLLLDLRIQSSLPRPSPSPRWKAALHAVHAAVRMR